MLKIGQDLCQAFLQIKSKNFALNSPYFLRQAVSNSCHDANFSLPVKNCLRKPVELTYKSKFFKVLSCKIFDIFKRILQSYLRQNKFIRGNNLDSLIQNKISSINDRLGSF